MTTEPEDQPGSQADKDDSPELAEKGLGRSLKDWAKSIFVTLVAVLLIKAFLVEAYVVRGASMEPTLWDGERLLLEKVSKRFGGFERGDIVVFRYPEDPRKLFIKRIIAVPGDTIRIAGERVWLNGAELKESYVPDNFKTFDILPPTVIPEGHYFVMGDHRSDSYDSRKWGTVAENEIIGKVMIRFWPLTRMDRL
ncbi:MAG: signal peptidase I [Planctomycetes bacterium]|nr:signal peptidase I [Planctomycetota bacterium]